jgi:rare lipoprotein A
MVKFKEMIFNCPNFISFFRCSICGKVAFGIKYLRNIFVENKAMLYKSISWVIVFQIIFLSVNAQFTQKGQASYYADKFNGRTTANGEKFSNSKMTAAHNTLPFNTMVKVTNLKNNKTVVVRINDRGPFSKGRIIDLSKAAANKIDMVADGVANVKIEVVDNNTTPGNSNKSSSPIELFSLKVDKVNSSGFGIQVGSYQYVENMLNEVYKFQEDFKVDPLIHVSNVKGKRVYRIIIGPYDTRDKAENQLKKFKKDGKDGFVISISNLK